MNEIIATIFSLNTLTASIRIATPIALAAMGGTFSERSGVINIGLEGMMLIGAFGGALGSYYTGNPWLGALTAVLMAGLSGLLFAVLTVSFRADQIVTGAGMNILALGLTTWLMQVIWGTKGSSPVVAGLGQVSIPILRDIPIAGTLLGTHSPLVYVMFFLAFIGWLLLFRTPFGLRIRMVGEHPEAADTLGINIKGVQYFGVITGSVLAGLGGAYLSLGQLSWFSMNMSAGRGYRGMAANIFGQWNPLGALGASFLFSFTDALQMRLQSLNLGMANELIQMLPYVLTILVLAGAVIRSRAPKGLGEVYETNK